MAADRDFGSLGAFLSASPPGRGGGGSGPSAWAAEEEASAARFSQGTRHVKGAGGVSKAAAPGTSLPMRPQEDPFQDSANLNRKVAFKMLRQLGCQVRIVEPEGDAHDGASSAVEAFIEVRLGAQPVLFQMLLEFGYHPFQTDNTLAIRVSQPRQRAREEVFAALAAPKMPRAPLLAEVGQVVRPRMSAQEVQDSVRRLSERKTEKAVEAAEAEAATRQKEPRKFKSAAEQKAALDRLLRTRDAQEDTSGDGDTPLPSQTSASTSSLIGARCVTWPRPVGRPRPSSTGAELRNMSETAPKPAKCSTVRPSPRLAQAGTFALQPPGSSNGHVTPDSSEKKLLVGGEIVPSVSSTTTVSESVALGETIPSKTQSDQLACVRDVAAEEVSEAKSAPVPHADASASGPEAVARDAEEIAAAQGCGLQTADESSEPEPKSRDWIDSMLGPLQWPGRASAGRSLERERIQRLAKPRPPPLPQDAPPVAAPPQKRSPRAQREACSRLAVPRAPATAQAQKSDAPESAASASDSCTDEERRSPRQVSAGSPSEDVGEAGEPRVVVIPSVLSQLPSGLERIDENAPAAGPVSIKSNGSETGRRQRASSVPPTAAPYAVPVLPALKAALGDSSGSGTHSRRNPRSRSAHQPREVHSERTASSLEQLLNDPDLVAEVVQDEIDENGMAGGEAMLAHIDRLYNSLLQKHTPAGGTHGSMTETEDTRASSTQEVSLEQRAAYDCTKTDGDTSALQHAANHTHATSAASSGPSRRNNVQREAHAGNRGPGRGRGQHSNVQMPNNAESANGEALLANGNRGPGSGRAQHSNLQMPNDSESENAEAPLANGNRGPGRGRAQNSNVQMRSDSESENAEALLANGNRGPGRGTAQHSNVQMPNDVESEDGEALLANIDQLYNDLLRSGQHDKTVEVDDKASSATSAVPEDVTNTLLPVTRATSGAEIQELTGVLEEVLWSALLMKRGTSGALDVQASLLELLPPHSLAQCFAVCGSNSLTLSLLQRLSAELPGVHTALTCTSPRLNGTGLKSIASLLVGVREARDRLLILASTSAVSTMKVPPSAPTPTDVASCTGTMEQTKKPKVRKTSMSHWTSGCLVALEAPPRRLAKKAYR